MSDKHNDDDFEDEDEDLVILSDEDGEPVEYIFLALIEVDGLEYAVLTPNEEPPMDDDPLEISLFAYSEDEEGFEVFSDIENDELFQRVQIEADRVLKEGAND